MDQRLEKRLIGSPNLSKKPARPTQSFVGAGLPAMQAVTDRTLSRASLHGPCQPVLLWRGHEWATLEIDQQ